MDASRWLRVQLLLSNLGVRDAGVHEADGPDIQQMFRKGPVGNPVFLAIKTRNLGDTMGYQLKNIKEYHR